jgi:DNA-directed RNA polymerase specialized sigma24 family protein
MFNAQDHDLAKFVAAQEKDRTKFFKELPAATLDDEQEFGEWLTASDTAFQSNLTDRALSIFCRFGFNPLGRSEWEPWPMIGFENRKPTQEVLDAYPSFHADLTAALGEYQEIKVRYLIFKLLRLVTPGTAVQKYNAIRAKWIEYAPSAWNEWAYWYMHVYGAADIFPSMINSTATLKPQKSGGNSLRDAIKAYRQETGTTESPHDLLSMLLPGYTDAALQERKGGEGLRRLRYQVLSSIEQDIKPYQPEENVVSYDAHLRIDGDTFADRIKADINAEPEARLIACCDHQAAMDVLKQILKSDRQMTAYILSEVHELKDQEIAKQMNTSLEAVKALLHKARKNVEKFRVA